MRFTLSGKCDRLERGQVVRLGDVRQIQADNLSALLPDSFNHFPQWLTFMLGRERSYQGANGTLHMTLGLFENTLSEQPQVVFPVGSVMAVAVHMPNVRHLLFFEISMHALANADQAVFVTAGQPQQL